MSNFAFLAVEWPDLHEAAVRARSVQGFYKKDELELLIQRRTTRKLLAAASINQDIVERYYQTRAIRRIGPLERIDRLVDER
jgi:type I restriction enzyme R subunit